MKRIYSFIADEIAVSIVSVFLIGMITEGLLGILFLFGWEFAILIMLIINNAGLLLWIDMIENHLKYWNHLLITKDEIISKRLNHISCTIDLKKDVYYTTMFWKKSGWYTPVMIISNEPLFSDTVPIRRLFNGSQKTLHFRDIYSSDKQVVISLENPKAKRLLPLDKWIKDSVEYETQF